MKSKNEWVGQPAGELLKSFLIFSRTVDHVLESRAVETVSGKPLAPSKVRLLRLLGHRGAQTSSTLARFLDVTKPAVTQIVDSMVVLGLVKRRVGEQDSREVWLDLTSKGRGLLRMIQRKQLHLTRVALRTAGGAATAEWLRVLRDVTIALAKADRAYSRFCLQCGAHEDGTCVLTGGDATCVFLANQHRAEVAAQPPARVRGARRGSRGQSPRKVRVRA